MWVQRILVLLLLERVLGHTLSRYEPQETEVYELKQDKDASTIQFVYPKSSVPKLREIIYYHIIEKPYPNSPEETTVEVSPETERLPTNTHGYQFSDNLLVDYDSVTEPSTNSPEVQESYYNEDSYLYELPATDHRKETLAEDAKTYGLVEKPAETTNQEESIEQADTAKPEVTAAEEATELKEETTKEDNTYNVEEDLLTQDSKAGPYVTDDNTDLTETNTDLTKTDSYLAETNDTMPADNTADVAEKTNEAITEETSDESQVEDLGDAIKKLAARNQLYGDPDKMKERLLKIRSYLPRLHPLNSQFSWEEDSSERRRRRRRRSVHTKRNSRRRREILYIYPQSRSLSEPYDENEIPIAPTLSPMDTAGLPDFIRSELNPERENAESEAEISDAANKDAEFFPPPDTYGVKLDNGNGYVWNTLYGSANSEPGVTGEEEYTPYPAAIEELPTALSPYGDSQYGDELGVTEKIPSDIPESTFVGVSEEVAVEPDDVGEIPADEVTEELTEDDENVEDSLPEEIEEVTIMEGSPDDIASKEETTEKLEDTMKQKLLEIFDSLRDLEKKGEPGLDHQKIKSRIHEYLEAEKSLLLKAAEEEPVEQEVTEEEEAEQEEPAITDDSLDQEKEHFGNDDGDIATETDSEGEPIVPEEHDTYGFRLIGGQGEVWNDFTGVRYHVGNDEPNSDNFDDFETGSSDSNKPDDNTQSILESFNDVTDKHSEFDKTTEDKTNVDDNKIKNVSSKNYIDIICNIFKDLKNFTHHRRDKQVSTALPDLSESSDQASPFLALLEDDMYRDWVREWTIEYTRFLSEYINDTVQAAIAKKELELLNAEAPIEEETGTARLYINDRELTKSPEVDTIINTISDKYLRRRRKHCQQSESNAEVAAENIYGGSLNSGKIVNVFVFFTEEQGEKILDLIKPGSKDEETDPEYIDSSDGEYKPDESEKEEAEEEENIDDNEILVPPNVEEVATEPSDSIETADQETLEPVDETTEPSTDDAELDALPVEHPEWIEEPEVAEEPAEEMPEDSEAEENLAGVTELAEEPETDQEIIETEPAEKESESEIENVATADIDEVTAEPIEIFTDEETVGISELPDEPALEEEERGDAEFEIDEPNLSQKEPEVQDPKPIEKEEVVDAEYVEEIEVDAEPVEQELEDAEHVEEETIVDAEPVEEEVEDSEHVEEERVVDAEPIEEDVEDSEHVEAEEVEDEEEETEPKDEEGVNDTEPVEEEAVVDAEPMEQEAAITERIVEEAVTDAEPIAEEAVSDTKPVDDAVVEAEPLEEAAVNDDKNAEIA